MNMEIMQILSIGIVGAGVSLLISLLKSVFKEDLTGNKTRAVLIGISIIAAAILFWIYQTPYWQPFLGILGAASTFYAFFLQGKQEDPVVESKPAEEVSKKKIAKKPKKSAK